VGYGTEKEGDDMEPVYRAWNTFKFENLKNR
jgi:hypothetical protein